MLNSISNVIDNSLDSFGKREDDTIIISTYYKNIKPAILKNSKREVKSTTVL